MNGVLCCSLGQLANLEIGALRDAGDIIPVKRAFIPLIR